MPPHAILLEKIYGAPAWVSGSFCPKLADIVQPFILGAASRGATSLHLRLPDYSERERTSKSIRWRSCRRTFAFWIIPASRAHVEDHSRGLASIQSLFLASLAPFPLFRAVWYLFLFPCRNVRLAPGHVFAGIMWLKVGPVSVHFASATIRHSGPVFPQC